MKERTIDLSRLIELEEAEIKELKQKLYEAIKDKSDYSSPLELGIYEAIKKDLKL